MSERILDLRGRNPDAGHPQHVTGATTVMIEALGIAEIFVAGREPAVRPELFGRALRRSVATIAEVCFVVQWAIILHQLIDSGWTPAG